MRVLWIAPTEGLYRTVSSNPYNGSGWVGGLQKALLTSEQSKDIQLGFTFINRDYDEFKVEKDNCTYYPLDPDTGLKDKIYRHLHHDRYKYQIEIERVIDDFKPDIVQIYGTELPLSCMINCVKVPSVVHLQGFLNPYSIAFFPPGMSNRDIRSYSIKEKINNILHGTRYQQICRNAIQERKNFASCRSVMGRTEWDKEITDLLAPQAKYYHVDEVLREKFYNASSWQYIEYKEVKIFTTLSGLYLKGLDFVLKAASLMKELGIKFHWRIGGITSTQDTIQDVENCFHLHGNNLGVEYLGILSADDIIREIHNASIYVHPSYIDNSPNSVCEAQMLGIPCIACNDGGLGTLIQNNVTGWLIPANAPYELAYRIKHYRELDIERISVNEQQAARQRHNRYKIITELLEVYQKTIKNS